MVCMFFFCFFFSRSLVSKQGLEYGFENSERMEMALCGLAALFMALTNKT